MNTEGLGFIGLAVLIAFSIWALRRHAIRYACCAAAGALGGVIFAHHVHQQLHGPAGFGFVLGGVLAFGAPIYLAASVGVFAVRTLAREGRRQ